MKVDEIDGLAKATCYWLAYRGITGFQNVLSEQMLSIPISEFLTARTNWVLLPELQYQNLCNSKKLPDFWCDFAGKPTYGDEVRFILESKLLKSPAKNIRNRIAADIIRLSLPLNKGLKRYFVLAGLENYFPEPDEDFLFGQSLFGLSKGQGRYIRPKEEAQKTTFLKAFPLFQEIVFSDQPYLSDFAYVQCCADHKVLLDQNKEFRVLVWSVGRSNRQDAA